MGLRVCIRALSRWGRRMVKGVKRRVGIEMAFRCGGCIAWGGG